MIQVAHSMLPPIEKYMEYLQGIWQRNHLTNNGKLVQELEQQLQTYLQAQNLYFVNNGTMALQIAIKALGLTGEIITTPFSFVATTSSIVWENCTPVFVDIETKSLAIDPEKIEQAITSKTQAILATHVFGNPCAIEEIEQIANKHQLKVIYDAAHSFGVKYNNIPLVNYGDISTLSHHATKLFHTIEGGSIVCRDPVLGHSISQLRNFGQNTSGQIVDLGVNGKNSEFHAAMGLCLLPEVDSFIARRKVLSQLYDTLLLNERRIRRPEQRVGTAYNYSYYAILFESEAALLSANELLEKHHIKPRRYFYPCLSTLSYVASSPVPIAESVSKRVLCLPMYESLSEEIVIHIASLILQSLKKSIPA